MKIKFSKYQGTGNDFIIIDHRVKFFPERNRQQIIERLCDRKFGIGADGLIMVENHLSADFEMIYFNADGREATLCGNGGRCVAHFAFKNDMARELMLFEAYDGLHQARILEDNWVSLEMKDVNRVISLQENAYQLDTGSPHYISFEKNLDQIDVVSEGQKVRYSDSYQEVGINVNFVEVIDDNSLKISTYERGVEDETLACGTGVTAAAIAHLKHGNLQSNTVNVQSKGGPLRVKLIRTITGYTDIWLEGPVGHVFEGEIQLSDII